jgi:hypothetical protein
MTQPVSRANATQGKPGTSAQVSTDLLIKGALCAVIGLAVLISPGFMPASPLRATVSGAFLVGWFSLVLGAGFLVQFTVRRWQIGRRRS